MKFFVSRWKEFQQKSQTLVSEECFGLCSNLWWAAGWQNFLIMQFVCSQVSQIPLVGGIQAYFLKVACGNRLVKIGIELLGSWNWLWTVGSWNWLRAWWSWWCSQSAWSSQDRWANHCRTGTDSRNWNLIIQSSIRWKTSLCCPTSSPCRWSATFRPRFEYSAFSSLPDFLFIIRPSSAQTVLVFFELS